VTLTGPTAGCRSGYERPEAIVAAFPVNPDLPLFRMKDYRTEPATLVYLAYSEAASRR
jgi:hypothetical protein